MNALAANAAGRKSRPRCGSARRKLREERESASTQPTVSSVERRVYQPEGEVTSSVTSRATTSTKSIQGGGPRVQIGPTREPEVSLRALHSAKDEEARWKSRDEARWVEVEQLVTALKDSKDEPQLKPLPALHARGQVDKLIFAQPSVNSWVNEYKYR